MKNKGCSLSGPVMLKAKSSEKKFLCPKICEILTFYGPGDQGVWKVAIFTAKGTSLRECTSFEPFCVKIGCSVWPPGLSRKKSQKVLDSHRNDVSPLTQGLRYRAACDFKPNFKCSPLKFFGDPRTSLRCALASLIQCLPCVEISGSSTR